MRASYMLLAVATLLATCDAATAVKTEVTKNLKSKERFLRSHESTTKANWEDSDNEKGEEERGLGIRKFLGIGKTSQKVASVEKVSQVLAAKKAYQKALSLEKAAPPNYFALDDLTRMVDDRNFRIDKFEKWYLEKYTVGFIREKLDLEHNPGFEKILLRYINEYKPLADKYMLPVLEKAEKVGGVKKVRFGENTETTIAKIDEIMAKALATTKN